MTTPEGQPANEEHAAARQAELNRLKEERRATLSPAEQDRLSIIEEVSERLVEAKIPFLLYADSVPFEESLERGCFWQFNKMGYEETFEEVMTNAQPRLHQLTIATLRDLSRRCHGTFIWLTPEGKPHMAATAGVCEEIDHE